MTSADLLDDQAKPVSSTGGEDASAKVARVLLYSDDVRTREAVRNAIGRRPSRNSPSVEFVEVATHEAAISLADEGGFDLFIFDGEAAKFGGMGLCRQLKHELDPCPRVLILTGRVQDAWLASWSQADAVVPHPIDPIELAAATAAMLVPASK